MAYIGDQKPWQPMRLEDDSLCASRMDASESWDDDFEFQSSASAQTGQHPDQVAAVSRSVATPSREDESWDDAYEDEDHGVPERDRVDPQRESDIDTTSWGSDSDWSRDGDAEDFSHESYTHHSSEPLESPSPTYHRTAFLTMSHSRAPAALTSISASLFSHISPVKKWTAHEGPKPEASRSQPKLNEATERKGEHSPRRGSTTTPVDTVHSQSASVKRVFSATNLPFSLQSRQPKSSTPPRNGISRNTLLPSPPLTPDLTVSPSSASSTTDTPPPLLPSRLRPVSKARHSKSEVRSGMLSPTPTRISTHNLPSTVGQHASPATPRRSSLGDLKRPGHLKIPDRIFRAQREIKRDIEDVKEFAACIEQLKRLRHIYTPMLRNLRKKFSSPSPPSSLKKRRRGTIAFSSPTASPTMLTRKLSFATPSPSIGDPLTRLDVTYGVWWECAELLISLSGSYDSDKSFAANARNTGGHRPRAVTLGSGSDVVATSKGVGPSPSSPQSSQWRATTGHVGPRDFTPRQLALLRGMLGAEAGKGWDPRSATFNVREGATDGSPKGKGWGGNRGLGIRDLWRGLRRGNATEKALPSSGGDSSASEGSGFALKESSSPSKLTITTTTTAAVLACRRQPTRRPSLAGIFGLGQRVPPSSKAETIPSHTDYSSDWDADWLTGETIRDTFRRRRKSRGGPVFSRATTQESSSSPEKLPANPSFSHSPRLFATFMDGSPSASDSPKSKHLFSSARPPSRRDALSLTHLALTPENIRPLLGHARDISARLDQCISEVRQMTSCTPSP